MFPTTFTQINQIMNKKDPKYFIQKMKRKKKKNQKMNMKEPKELYSRNEKKKKKNQTNKPKNECERT